MGRHQLLFGGREAVDEGLQCPDRCEVAGTGFYRAWVVDVARVIDEDLRNQTRITGTVRVRIAVSPGQCEQPPDKFVHLFGRKHQFLDPLGDGTCDDFAPGRRVVPSSMDRAG